SEYERILAAIRARWFYAFARACEHHNRGQMEETDRWVEAAHRLKQAATRLESQHRFLSGTDAAPERKRCCIEADCCAPEIGYGFCSPNDVKPCCEDCQCCDEQQPSGEGAA